MTGSESQQSETAVERVYVWDLVVRGTHWLIALSTVVLAATGYYIGKPFVIVAGAAGDHFIMGWVHVVHDYAAIVFTLSVLARIAWMLLNKKTANWREFIPFSRERQRNIWQTLKFYLFLRRKAPAGDGHNPLAGLVYSLVFLLYLGLIITGLGLHSVGNDSYMRVFDFLLPLLGEAQQARWLHHVGMWVLLMFVVLHVYLSFLVSRVEGNGTLDSIFSGFKFLHRGAEEVRDAEQATKESDIRKKADKERHAA